MTSLIELIRSEPNASVVLSTVLLMLFLKGGYETLKKGFKTNPEEK